MDASPRPSIDILQEIPLLFPLDQPLRERIITEATLLTLRNRQLLFHEGEPARHLHILAHGALMVSRLGEEWAEQGGDRLVRVVTPGEPIGLEAVLLKPQIYQARATATVHSQVLALPIPLLHALITASLPFALELMRYLSRRVREHQSEVDTLRIHSAPLRVARFLLENAEGRPTDRSATLFLPLSKQRIASHLGLRQETFSRALSYLAQRGLISVDRRDIQVHDTGALRQLAGKNGTAEPQPPARRATPGG